jgi:hypothetical protein
MPYFLLIDILGTGTIIKVIKPTLMKTLQMFGASDDLIEVSGIKGADEFNIVKDGPYITSFNISGKIRIHAIYDGCWSFAPGQVDEDIPLPNWPIRIKQSEEKDYSTLLEIDVPDDSYISLEH